MNDFELLMRRLKTLQSLIDYRGYSFIRANRWFSLKTSAYGDLYLVDNEFQDIPGQVTDYDTYYVLEDVGLKLHGLVWDEASDQSEDGNAHVGYGIAVDMDSLSAEELESLNSAFPPASDAYSVDDIVHMRLVHWEKTDAEGNIVHDWCHVQHFDEDYNTLGQVGYDGVNNLYHKCGCTHSSYRYTRQ